MAQSQFSTHTSFNRSPLVRLLASLDIATAADSDQTLAETLSHWVAWTDAIALSGALDNEVRRGKVAADASSGACAMAAAREDVARVRKELLDAIALDSMFAADRPRKNDGLSASSGLDMVELPLYRRRYQAHQRGMEERIGALRARVRGVAAMASPDLHRLAALDAVLDTALLAHQRRVLSRVPELLERRFKAWARAARVPQSGPGDGQEGDAGAPGDMPDLRQTMRGMLLAELDLRLQPIEGMMQAIGTTATGQT
ncbi:MAG: DUF3348 family protein [Burkholderiaceae bacterium]